MSRDRYGARAARSYRALIDPVLRPLRPRIVQVCREVGATRVLDIACATGAQCRLLGKAGMETIGLDLSQDMVAAAQQAGGRNTRYVCGSAYELPFEDGEFDAALLSLALHEHTEDERAVMFAEAQRVIRPAGTLVIADYTRPGLSAIHIPWQLIRVVEWIAGPEHNAGFRDYISRGDLRELADRHDLDIASIRSSHFGAIGIAIVAI